MSALTTAEGAKLLGMEPSSFRRAMMRARDSGVDLRVPGPDARTPLWDGDGLRKWMESRPGRGWWRANT